MSIRPLGLVKLNHLFGLYKFEVLFIKLNVSGIFGKTQTENDQTEVCSRLMELNVQLQSSIAQLEHQYKATKTTCRLSKVSSASA